MPVPSENLARTIVERLQNAGHVAYYAGGRVRDRLIGRVPQDFDVATSARPEQILALYPRAQQVGVSFGVVLVRGRSAADGSFAQVEVATFRADGTYSDGRRPDSVRFTDAREDALRRDFTCNGLFFDPLANGSAGEVHDFVGGKADIGAKVLRAIGDPAARFGEDHLRMLRAVRFAGKLGFTIEPATLAAMQAHAPHIKTVSRERVHDELALILEHPSRTHAVALLESAQLLRQLWPHELYPQPDTPRRFHDLAALPARCDFIVALAALCRDIAVGPGSAVAPTAGGASEVIRGALMLSNVETADLGWLLDRPAPLLAWPRMSKAALKRHIADPRWPRLQTLFEHASLESAERPTFAARVAALQAEGVAPDPLVTGATLISLGASPGPAFRRWIEQLYDRQLEGELNTPEEAVAAAKRLIGGQG